MQAPDISAANDTSVRDANHSGYTMSVHCEIKCKKAQPPYNLYQKCVQHVSSQMRECYRHIDRQTDRWIDG
eukprot:2744808-Rhodomonas_salina.2